MRYSLLVKALQGGPVPTAAPLTPNPAMQRQGTVPMDEGRPWSGEKYDEGPVSDPEQAFARFGGGGEDTEAWLDKNEDGTLIGWVREGADIYRYSDPEAWALDVDGAQMQRTDDGATVDPEADGMDPADSEDLPDEEDPAVVDAEDPSIGESAPEGFNDEEDPATTDADPTEHLEDPTDLPDEGEYDNPFAEVLDGDDEDTPDDETAEENPGDTPDDTEPDADGDDAEDPDEETDDPDNDGDAASDDDNDGDGEQDDDEDDKKKRIVGGKIQTKRIAARKIQVKHMPGKHNQEDHGNWADHLPHGHFPGHHRRSSGSSSSGGSKGGSSSSPKGGEPDKGDAPGKPAKVKLNAETVKKLSDEDLAAITEDGELYDTDTMFAAAEEFDSRHPIDDMTRGFAKHTEPGSPERAALFDSVIPDHWTAWVAQGGKGKPPKKNKRDEIKEAYAAHVHDQYLRAMEATNGYFFKKRYSTHQGGQDSGLDELAFFDGRANRAQVKKYASEELLRWFADNPRMTFSEFAAEFYPSYQKAKAKVGSRYLSEFG